MERRNWIRQAYGYLVCLIAVITVLISINGVVSNLIDLSDPAVAANGYDGSMESFDAFLENRNQFATRSGPDQVADTASLATLERRFTAIQTSRRNAQLFRARKSLATSGIVLIVAIGLFASHWRWLRKIEGVPVQEA